MKKMIMVAASILLMTSCATIVNSKNQQINVRSKSLQHLVLKDEFGNVVAKNDGNLTVLVPRSTGAFAAAKYTLQVGDKEIKILPSVDILRGVVGNFLIPGVGLLIGGIVDGITGSIYQLYTDQGQYASDIVVE